MDRLSDRRGQHRLSSDGDRSVDGTLYAVNIETLRQEDSDPAARNAAADALERLDS